MKENLAKSKIELDDSLNNYFKDLFIDSPNGSGSNITKSINQKKVQAQYKKQQPLKCKSMLIEKHSKNHISFSQPSFIQYASHSGIFMSSKPNYHSFGNNNQHLFIPKDKTLNYIIDSFKAGQLMYVLCTKDLSIYFNDLSQTDSNIIMNLILRTYSLHTLVTNQNSSYLIKKLLQNCSSEMRLQAIKHISAHILHFLTDINATQVLKLLLDLGTTPIEQHYLQSIAGGNLLNFMFYQFGIDFIIILIKKVKEDNREFLNQTLLCHFVPIALHPYGHYLVS